VLGCRPSTQDTPGGGIRAQGLLTSHYATKTPLQLINGPGLWLRLKQLRTQGVHVACMTLDQPPLEICHAHRKHIIDMPNEPQAYARGLYRVMRNLDCGNYDLLLVEAPPQTEEWSAINNRLQRAATNKTMTGEIAYDSKQFRHSTP
jgi:L-threonylcarbamoyladenylate synthase